MRKIGFNVPDTHFTLFAMTCAQRHRPSAIKAPVALVVVDFIATQRYTRFYRRVYGTDQIKRCDANDAECVEKKSECGVFVELVVVIVQVNGDKQYSE